jgi:hypothetical protein
MEWVWKNSPLKGSQLLVHLALAADSSGSGYCWSTPAHIAEQARTSYMTAKNAITALKNEDLLKTEEMYGHKSVFHLLTPQIPAAIEVSDNGAESSQKEAISA